MPQQEAKTGYCHFVVKIPVSDASLSRETDVRCIRALLHGLRSMLVQGVDLGVWRLVRPGKQLNRLVGLLCSLS
jgi:hypothetical protein